MNLSGGGGGFGGGSAGADFGGGGSCMMKDILLTKPEIVDYSKSVHRILKGKVLNKI